MEQTKPTLPGSYRRFADAHPRIIQAYEQLNAATLAEGPLERKTAELVKRLRAENKALEDELGRARGRVQEAEQKLQALERQAGTASAKGREREEQELRALRQEREEVRRRITALVEILDGLE